MYSTRIGHVHLKVRDLQKAVDFYMKFFDLEVTEIVGDHYAFLSGCSLHHEIALQQVGTDAPQPPRSSTGLYHVAFEVPDKEAFALAYQNLTEAGIPVYPVDHLISWALYFSDPDGNGLEIYVDTRQESHGRDLWHGRNLPLDSEKVLGSVDSHKPSSAGERSTMKSSGSSWTRR